MMQASFNSSKGWNAGSPKPRRPANAVPQGFAFLGRRGSGKTYAGGDLVEGLLELGAQVGTIRTRLLKIGGVVKVSVRRVAVALSSVYPLQALFRQVLRNIQRAYPSAI